MYQFTSEYSGIYIMVQQHTQFGNSTFTPPIQLPTIPPGLVHYWTGDNNFLDLAGGDSGIPSNNPSFVPAICNSVSLFSI